MTLPNKLTALVQNIHKEIKNYLISKELDPTQQVYKDKLAPINIHLALLQGAIQKTFPSDSNVLINLFNLLECYNALKKMLDALIILYPQISSRRPKYQTLIANVIQHLTTMDKELTLAFRQLKFTFNMKADVAVQGQISSSSSTAAVMIKINVPENFPALFQSLTKIAQDVEKYEGEKRVKQKPIPGDVQPIIVDLKAVIATLAQNFSQGEISIYELIQLRDRLIENRKNLSAVQSSFTHHVGKYFKETFRPNIIQNINAALGLIDDIFTSAHSRREVLDRYFPDEGAHVDYVATEEEVKADCPSLFASSDSVDMPVPDEPPPPIPDMPPPVLSAEAIAPATTASPAAPTTIAATSSAAQSSSSAPTSSVVANSGKSPLPEISHAIRRPSFSQSRLPPPLPRSVSTSSYGTSDISQNVFAFWQHQTQQHMAIKKALSPRRPLVVPAPLPPFPTSQGSSTSSSSSATNTSAEISSLSQQLDTLKISR